MAAWPIKMSVGHACMLACQRQKPNDPDLSHVPSTTVIISPSEASKARSFIKGSWQLFRCSLICGTSWLKGPRHSRQFQWHFFIYFNSKITKKNCPWWKKYYRSANYPIQLKPFCFLTNWVLQTEKRPYQWMIEGMFFTLGQNRISGRKNIWP